MVKRFVTYFRVSTKRQGDSGLGLDAQREAVRAFIGNGQVVATFEEVESGGRSDRPALEAALRACRLQNATLLIAKLDRLARSVAFIARLIEENVDFLAVDNPHANKAMVQMMAVFAEMERDMVSKRTKAALQAAKARGVRLGNPHGATQLQAHGNRARAASALTRSTRASSRAEEAASIIADVRAGGANSLREIAGGLNGRAIPAPRGGEWSPGQVRRVLAQARAV